MKKILFSLFAVGMLATQACNNEATVDPAQTEAMVNEQAAAKIKEAEAEATAACEQRMANELQHMTDSMVHDAQMAAATTGR
ncbi:MAG: hypothetical protein JNM95_13165 [Chitinophagaceae bacterium]|nr:hypothetical protein [Chitinophagaceae bacterium]